MNSLDSKKTSTQDVAQDMYRELINKGLSHKDVLAISSELVACITKNLNERMPAHQAN